MRIISVSPGTPDLIHHPPSDIISFGIAPVVGGYSRGLRGGLDMLLLLFFVGCGISRLARFNITAADLADVQGKVRYFEGLPIPSSLLLILVLARCFALGRVGDHLLCGVVTLSSYRWHPLSLFYFANGGAMISKTLRIPKW
jgi:CDP-diacylglycerol---serine O-phosphatidyltransferase